MFESLKNKLKNWKEKITSVFKEEKTEEKRIKEKPFKKEKKTREKIKKEIVGKKEIEKEEIYIQQEENKKEGFFSKFFKRELSEEKFDELFQELELTLLENNVSFVVVQKIKEELKKEVVGKNDYNLEESLKRIIKDILIEPENFLKKIKDSLKNKKPFVILFLGINGTGKTTTLAKIAYLLKKNNLSVCFAAADTYRAASIEQLEEHAKRLNISLIKKDYGVDPASVGFEAIQYAKKNNIDVVLIDSAGRLNNKESLMNELEKISRVNNPDMKIFVGESITGNDSIEQAKAFDEKINLTGSILSKADVDEKGGTILSVGFVTKKPILFLGTGQKYEDLEEFNKEKVIERLGL